MLSSTKFWYLLSLLAILGVQPAFADLATNKILIGSHSGDATIISLMRIDSDKVQVFFRRELDDLIEDCSRNIGIGEDGIVPSAKIAKCATDGLRAERSRIYTRRAFCSRATLYTEFGNFSMISYAEELIASGHQLVKTNWKNHADETIIGNCSACGTPQLLDTYRILCPSWYKAAFDNRTPY